MFKKLKVRNFRSLKDFEIEFGKFNVLIGRNNSGKSNIVEVLSFLKEGFYNNIDEIFNKRGTFRDVVFGKNDENDIEIIVEYEKEQFEFKYYIKISGKHNRPNVTDEKLWLKEGSTEYKFGWMWEELSTAERAGMVAANYELIKEGHMSFRLFGRHILENFSPHNIMYPEGNRMPLLEWITGVKSEELQKMPKVSEMFLNFFEVFKNFQSYTFIPKNIKDSIPDAFVQNDLKLSKYGSNLPLVLLKCLQEDRENFNRIEELLHGVVDEISSIHPAIEGSKVYLKLKNTNFDSYFFFWEASDGTIALLSYITAIQLTEKNSLLCFEEPENNIYPRIFEFLVDLISKSDAQIILTTHSPDIVNLADENDLIIIRKCDDGTKALRNAEKIRELKKSYSLNTGEMWRSGVLTEFFGER